MRPTRVRNLLSWNQHAARFSGRGGATNFFGMTIEFPETQITANATKDTPNLRVSVIYQDVASGLRAKACLDRLERNLNAGVDVFALRLWSCDLLSEPAFRKAAAREAGEHEIVFLSKRDSSEPPPVLKAWLEEWLKCRNNRPCALAVLLDEDGPIAGDTPLLNYLGEVAEVGGLDLVYPGNKISELPLDQDSIRQIARRAINASPVLEGILDDWESYSHWGINE
jgi:hypothetical protein